jgi:hypothetical protein
MLTIGITLGILKRGKLKQIIRNLQMPRIKRSSDIIDKAAGRLAGLQSIDPNLDLGKGITAEAFSEVIEAARQKVNAYNTTLSRLDAE